MSTVVPDPAALAHIARSSVWSWPPDIGQKPRPSRANRPGEDEREVSQRLRTSLPAAPPGRRKLWDFATHLHRSIIGTCLSTGELRQVLIKLGHSDAATASEHDLHASGVVVAGKRHDGAKLLHKTLDRRHRVSISQFVKAKTAEEVRAAWKEAMRRGDIPGGYWAALSHPTTSEALLREIFADVHMLSHLVGAANRADIRRLRQQEEAKAELEAKAGRQQQQLRDAVVSRDVTIRELRRALEERIVQDRNSDPRPTAEPDSPIWMNLIADLKRRLAAVESRHERLEHELKKCRSSVDAERAAHAETKRRNSELQQELEQVEASLADLAEPNSPAPQSPRLSNLTLLYVGGRQAQIAHLRTFAERSGVHFLHHDGGVEERSGLLQGLISRADTVLFPVDCISHAAMSQVKRTCRQSGKPLVPLRGAGLAPFCAVLNNPAVLTPRILSSDGG
jgi:hypothetical protein